MATIKTSAARVQTFAWEPPFPSLFKFTFDIDGGTLAFSSGAQTSRIVIKYNSTQDISVLVNPETQLSSTDATKNALLVNPATGIAELILRVPSVGAYSNYFLPTPGQYTVTLPGTLFAGNSAPISSGATPLVVKGSLSVDSNGEISNPQNEKMFVLMGGAGNDKLRGGNKSDLIEGGKGNDTIIGGGREARAKLVNGELVFQRETDPGTEIFDDVAFYGADRSNFTVSKTGAGFTVVDKRGANGLRESTEAPQ